MPYLLDTNVFIQAKNLHYGFDFCPASWDWLVQRNAPGQIFRIERIGEIEAGGDELSDWAARCGIFCAPRRGDGAGTRPGRRRDDTAGL